MDASEMLCTSCAASVTPVTISPSAFAVSFAIRVPFSTLLMEFLISSVVSFAAFAERAARLRTSSATTVKPLPCCPALAASTAALSARMLVWNAMSSMTLMIFEMLSEETLISSIESSIAFICSLPFSANSLADSASLLAWSASFAFCLVCTAISSMEAVSSSTELACSVAPCESATLDSDTCLAPAETWADATLMSLSMPLNDRSVWFMASLILTYSPVYSPFISTVRFPEATSCITSAHSMIGSATASIVLFRPPMISLYAPSNLFSSPRTFSAPSYAAFARVPVSSIRLRIVSSVFTIAGMRLSCSDRLPTAFNSSSREVSPLASFCITSSMLSRRPCTSLIQAAISFIEPL